MGSPSDEYRAHAMDSRTARTSVDVANLWDRPSTFVGLTQGILGKEDMQHTVSTRLGLWLAVLFTAVGLMTAPSTAHAHDVLVESTPEMGSTVETTPDEVRLRFSGTPLTGEGLTNLIRVTDDQGNEWQDGEVVVEGYELAVPLCETLPQGEYTVAYRVIYSDGHTGEERFNFTNADPEAPANGTPESCGAVGEEPAPTAGATDSDDTQDTSNAENTADENSSASIPGWVWVVGGVGILVIAAIVYLLMRGSRTGPAAEDSSGD